MKIDVIFAIASGQIDPLILPFLSDKINCKKLVLFVSNQIKTSRIELNIEAALKKKGIKVTIVYGDEQDFTWEGIQENIEKQVKEHKEQVIAFNSNGGTKPMALAAFEYCYTSDLPVFYINGNLLEWLHVPNKMALEPETIQSSLAYQDYLLSHGYEILKKTDIVSSPDIAHLIKGWGGRSQASEIGRLNKLAAKGDKNNLVVKLDEKEQKDSHLQIMLDELASVDLIAFKGKDKIVFKSEESRFFVNGGWYELYLQKLLEKINANYFNAEGKVFSSIELKPIYAKDDGSKKVKNEIDVAYLLNNRLFMFECKTANLASKHGRADEAIYKLASLLENIGGTNATGIISTYRKIEKVDKERAGLLGIRIIEHTTDEKNLINIIVTAINKDSKRL
jgi:hypothetical protein